MADTRQVGALILVAGAVCAFWALGDKDSSDEHEVSGKISEVKLDSPNADITIKVGGETLRLTSDCGWQCHVDFEVTVPRGTKVTGENGSGDLSIAGVSGVDASSRSGRVELEDISGDVKLELTSGEAAIDRLTGKLDFEATSGDLSAEHLKGGPVNVKTTSGDLHVSLDEAADVTAEGTSSEIHIEAPAGDYQINTKAQNGDVDNNLTDNPAATHKINATTVSGDIDLSTN